LVLVSEWLANGCSAGQGLPFLPVLFNDGQAIERCCCAAAEPADLQMND
jgi:hypothetical protein